MENLSNTPFLAVRLSSDDESPDHYEQPIKKSRSRIFTLLFIVALCLLVTIVVILLRSLATTSNAFITLLSSQPQGTNPQYQSFDSCGSTPSEARYRGCAFDVFSYAWTPARCWDDELYSDILSANMNLTYYSLGDATALPGTEVLLGQHERVQTTWKYHLVACAYGWQKLSRQVLMQVPLDNWTARQEMVVRCSTDLIEKDKREAEQLLGVKMMDYLLCGLDDEAVSMLQQY